jgi:hypothetical protein
VSVQIAVQVRPEVAAGLRGQAGAPEAPAPPGAPEATAPAGAPEAPALAGAPEARALKDVAESLGASPRPVQPSGGDPELGVWFTLEAPDRAAAEQAVEVLRALDGVTAAYVKAPAEPP